jgi:hypothetical protein
MAKDGLPLSLSGPQRSDTQDPVVASALGAQSDWNPVDVCFRYLYPYLKDVHSCKYENKNSYNLGAVQLLF